MLDLSTDFGHLLLGYPIGTIGGGTAVLVPQGLQQRGRDRLCVNRAKRRDRLCVDNFARTQAYSHAFSRVLNRL